MRQISRFVNRSFADIFIHDMGIQAAAAYLRSLREARHLGRGSLASQLGIDHTQIERIEKGQTDTRGSLLLQIVHTLQGSPEQLTELMVNPAATPEDGRRLAQEWLASGRALHLAREELDALADGLAEDPAQLQRWLGYGARLLEERKRQL